MMRRAGLPLYGIVFAYGSNLDPERMHSIERCPNAQEIGNVRLVGWQFEIFAGAADLELAPTSFVPAVAWQLTPEDEERLDRREGAYANPPDYLKIALKALREDGSNLDGYTYVMSPHRRFKREHSPTEQYRGFLARGYLRHGFDASELEAAIARAENRDSAAMPAIELLEVLRASLSPCAEFAGTCGGIMRWEPQVGHIPRGWIGGASRLDELRLVLVTAEPGDPADGEAYAGADVDGMLRSVSSLGRSALSGDNLRREGRPAPFHRNLGRILDLCWPGDSLDQQLRKTWITPTVLCSASMSSGAVPRAVESVCAKHYLVPQLQLFPKAFIIALGSKAEVRLRRAGQRSDAIAQHPSARPNSMPERSWERAADLFRVWVKRRGSVGG